MMEAKREYLHVLITKTSPAFCQAILSDNLSKESRLDDIDAMEGCGPIAIFPQTSISQQQQHETDNSQEQQPETGNRQQQSVHDIELVSLEKNTPTNSTRKRKAGDSTKKRFVKKPAQSSIQAPAVLGTTQFKRNFLSRQEANKKIIAS